MAAANWKSYFKPEVQKNGDDYVKTDSAHLTVMSDTAINGFIKGGGSSKVSLTSKSIASHTFYAACTCTRAAKGHLCKHIWAVLMATEKKHPDFLDSKKIIEMAPVAEKAESPYKAKQDAYKKLQAEKLKARNKEQRLAKKAAKSGKPSKPSARLGAVPEEVTEAIQFFSVNGYAFENPIDPDELKEARKSLSRIFHPDKGGTHEEALALNTHYEVLQRFLL